MCPREEFDLILLKYAILPIALPTCTTKDGGYVKNWLGFNAVQLNYWSSFIVCDGFGSLA